jgi:mannose-6-phosphate isomerase-like protein (cupin superfamily)
MVTVHRGEGQLLSTPAVTSIICREEWADGNVLIFDQIVDPGTITAAHAHPDETQGAFVLEGEIGFWTDGEEVVAGPGAYVIRPPRSVHALWNATDAPARMLEITSPAERFSKFILGYNALLERGAATSEAVAAVATEHGTVFHPEVTAMLCERHGVSPIGGGFATSTGSSPE